MMGMYDFDKNVIESLNEVDEMMKKAKTDKERTRLNFEKMLRGLALGQEMPRYGF